MAVHRELRIHGVSGTPPRQILRTDPVTLDPKTEHIRVFRRAPSDRTDDAAGQTHEFDARAYHWGSLTTGHWLTAFWILLGPFAFANVAGWMNRRPSRLTHSAVRVVGVAMTALLVAQGGYLFVVILPRLVPAGWRFHALALSTVAYPALFVWGLVIRLSTQSHFTKLRPGEQVRLTLSPLTKHLLPRMFWSDPSPATVAGQWDDPAGADVTEKVTWKQHAIVHRLRRIHLAAGCGVIVALYGSRVGSDWLQLAALALAVVVAVVTVATSFAARSRWVLRATAILPLVSLALVAAGWTTLLAGGPGVEMWPGVHSTTFAVALALGASALAAAAAGLVPMGAIVTGTLFGASLGVGLSLIAERLAGLDAITERGAGWVAVAMFYLVLFGAGVAAVLALRGGPLPAYGRVPALARRVAERSDRLLAALGLFGLGAGAVAFGLGCIDVCSPQMLRTPHRGSPLYPMTIAAMAVVALLLSLALARVRRWWGLLAAVALGGGVTLFALGRLPTLSLARMAVDLNDLVDLSKAVVIVLPTLLIARSMVGSIRRGTSNRQVGILWDVASMWPRWYHPLAPPAYGPMVVRDLAHRLVIEPPDLLEAHSQGSVLSALAVRQMEEVPRFALLTYGNPIGMLYRHLFPEAGVGELVASVDERLGNRWLNLWRATDPVGGSPVGLGHRDLEVRDGAGHSNYEVSSDFVEARHRLV